MEEIKRIADQLKRAHEGEAWHGPSLRELLAGVTSEMAASKTLARAHNIWEIVLHGVIQHDLYHAGQIALLKKV
ncbi:hypothetical protein L0337_35545 [candidate division KSB1 bacterium]|nr:hypothetical protein [candidate division KSB1 bacterium]